MISTRLGYNTGINFYQNNFMFYKLNLLYTIQVIFNSIYTLIPVLVCISAFFTSWY